MDEARMIELLVELHEGLDRLGPGDEGSTLKALGLCADLPAAPDVLDVGCGTGAQALLLAQATGGRVTAVDLAPAFVATARARAAAAGSADRVTVEVADMNALSFADGAFDLVWSEGAIYLMGFDAGLAAWRRLLRPGGYLVVSEASWFSDDPPAELTAYWAESYPAMRSVEANAAAAAAAGWEVVAAFRLPDAAWTDGYYGPLRERLPAFRARHAGDDEALGVAAATEQEMAMFDAHSSRYGYAFYVLRRPA